MNFLGELILLLLMLQRDGIWDVILPWEDKDIQQVVELVFGIELEIV